MMHQSEFDTANVALSRAADKRKSLINIHKNWYTATLRWRATVMHLMIFIAVTNVVAITRRYYELFTKNLNNYLSLDNYY